MTILPCPACGEQVLVVDSSRWGGTLEAFDPVPVKGGGRYDTQLSNELSYVVGAGQQVAHLIGRVPLYRQHWHSCPEHCEVPMTVALPNWGHYRHRPATRGG